jgi:O-antigen/teichoic acid export membrane protein
MVKSAAIIGGSNVFVALMRIGQLKIFAVLLGPAGMGLMGLYSSVMTTVATVGGLGIASSGVRQISETSNSMDDGAAATALVALRRLTLVLGVTAAIGLFLLRKVVSDWVFGSHLYAGAVGVLSLGVLCTIISGSQVAVLNGLRRVNDIARVNVVGAAIGTAVTILLVLFWREQALVYAITSTTLIMLICSWWFVWRIPRPASIPDYAKVKAVFFSLLRLGAAFLFASLMMTIILLFTRVIIIEHLGMASAGYFQAAWGFVVFYIDFILTAMGVDFYPHLTSRIHDRKAANQLVNEQTEVALLLGGPLILGMILFAPALLFLFYSAKFGAATKLLRWLLLGNILKIISWPMGYLVIAHARAKTFVFVEIVWGSTYLGLMYLGIRYVGINAVGYAFVGSYLTYTAVVYLVVNRISGFAWTSMNLLFAVVVSLSAVLVMALVQQAGIAGYLVSGLVTLGVGIYSLRRLYRIVENETAVRILNAAKNILRSLFV